jgi:hypothetical protein
MLPEEGETRKTVFGVFHVSLIEAFV